MSIAVTCGGCGKTYKVADAFAGKKAKCKACGATMVVPGVAAAKPGGGAPPKAPVPPPLSVGRTPSAGAGAGQRAGKVAGSGGAKRAAGTPGAAKPAARREVAGVKPKAVADDFDLSALDDIERTGELHAEEPVTAASMRARPVAPVAKKGNYTLAPEHLRPGYDPKTRKVTGGDGAAAVVVTGDFWTWDNLKPGPGGIFTIAVLVLGLVCLFSATMAAFGGLALLFTGFGFCIYGVWRAARLAAAEGFVIYLLYRFVPFYAAYFVISRWEQARNAVFAWVKGIVLVVLGFALLMRAGGLAEALHDTGASSGISGMMARKSSSSDSSGGKGAAPLAGLTGDGTTDTIPDPNANAIDCSSPVPKSVAPGVGLVGPGEQPAVVYPERTEWPDLSEWGPFGDDGVTAWTRMFGEFRGNEMTVSVFMPKGEHAAGSVPCVLMPPLHAGFLQGAVFVERSDRPYLAWVKAGFAVVAYETSQYTHLNRPRDFGLVIKEYMNNHGGMDHTHNALEYTLRKVPQVDPERLFIVGRGLSSTLALVAAAGEPRIKACVAIDPIADLNARYARELKSMEQQRPCSTHFAYQLSPIRHVAELQCPVLLYDLGQRGMPVIEDIGDDEPPATPPATDAASTPDPAAAKPKRPKVSEVAQLEGALKDASKPVTIIRLAAGTPDSKEQDVDADQIVPQVTKWLNDLGKKAE